MNLILVCLPIRDAVRTSILSKKWRYKWVSIPDIVFDKDCLMKDKSNREHADVVDKVLSQHVGPICKFSCMSYVLSGSHFDRWIEFLSLNVIKKLSLKILEESYEYYDVASCIFDCEKLCHLELINCKLKVPPTFKGFHKLLVLVLNEVLISAEAIAYLISKCPLLETLKLRSIGSETCPAFYTDPPAFHIDAPNLRYLEIDGISGYLSKCPLLETLKLRSIGSETCPAFYTDPPAFHIDAPNLRYLEIDGISGYLSKCPLLGNYVPSVPIFYTDPPAFHIDAPTC
ncbi:F-box/FBD/LRR-repeat protein isoform X2 [Cinnamomum micranthum f. kanehirae]|uniref:F-box/FBD/LRR-repeat protein isoform X2 n=1 Tax=Cinnamomum micranthum f. kanehirae TaxID=337451 RepID=A0A443NRZ7_9MAGN|nr:F-box/FBD/LRR-repeat protein isoform X2 [Cinnamomum micranthum f. kanehirae]